MNFLQQIVQFKKNSVLVFVFLWANILFSQTTRIDSLNKNIHLIDKKISSFSTDTVKVNLLIELTKELGKIDVDSALIAGNKALQLSTKINWKKGVSNSLNEIAECYYSIRDFNEAVKYYKRSLKETNDDIEIIKRYSNIGLAYSNNGDYDLALENLKKALEKSRTAHYKEGIIKNLGNISNIFTDRGSYNLSLDYLQEALPLAIEIDNKNFIGSIYGNIGNVNYYKGDYNAAIENYIQALKINEDNQYEPADTLHLSCASQDEDCSVFVTLEDDLINNKYLEKLLNIKIKHPSAI